MSSQYPKSFQEFIKLTNSEITWDSTQIGTFKQTDVSTAYGLSAIYVAEDSVVQITVGALASGIDLTTVTEGYLGLYVVQPNTHTDYLLRTATFDSGFVVDDHINIKLHGVEPHQILIVAALLITSSNNYPSWVLAADDESKSSDSLTTVLSYIAPNAFSAQLENDRWTSPESWVGDKSQERAFTLDFSSSNPNNSIGTLVYNGGGNRYLTKGDSAILQTLNTAPWKLNASCFVEPSTSQLIVNPALTVSTSNDWTYTADAVVTEYKDTLAQYNATMLRYVIQQSSQDTTFNWELPAGTVQVAGTYTTSLFSAFEFDGKQSISVEFGVRVGTTELIGLVTSSELSLLSVTGTLPTGAATFFVRVKNLFKNNRVTLYIALPQLENSWASTSRVTSSAVRAKDFIVYTPDTVDYHADDYFEIVYYPGYAGVPTEDQYLFDSRSSDVGLEGTNGWYLYHDTTGNLVFGCVSASGVTSEVSAAFTAVLGQKTSITCFFTKNGLCISVNTALLSSTTSSVEIPTALLPIRLGHDYTESDWMVGQLLTFTLPNLGNDIVEGASTSSGNNLAEFFGIS